MRLLERQRGPLTVVEVHGALIAPAGSAMLTSSVRRLVHAGRRHLVIDLHDLTWMDAGGLGALVGAHNVMAAHRGSFAVAATGRRSFELLAITRLTDVFDVFASVEAALRDLQGSSPETSDRAAMRP
jgi:anti-sigma B factor antagonist